MNFEKRRRLLIQASADPCKDGLKDSYGRYVFDSNGSLVVCSDGAYTSLFEGAAIDAMIEFSAGG